MREMEFSAWSAEFSHSLSAETRRAMGIYFTPRSHRELLWEKIGSVEGVRAVLEPSAGSGEFVDDAVKRLPPSARIVAIERHANMAASLAARLADRVDVSEGDFLLQKMPDSSFDLIVGNPPFAVVPRASVPIELLPFAGNRPNLSALFVAKCVQLLAPGGTLALVLPASFCDSVYYAAARELLARECSISFLGRLRRGFVGSTQPFTMGLVAVKDGGGGGGESYVFRREGFVILNEDGGRLRDLCRDSSTLARIGGFSVATGGCVWTRIRDRLADEASSAASVLVYAADIQADGALRTGAARARDPAKKPYVIDSSIAALKGPAIFVSRGFGDAYSLRIALLAEEQIEGKPFVAENHVNVILPETPEAAMLMGRLYEALCSPRTRAFVESMVRCNTLSKTYLERLVPICLDSSSYVVAPVVGDGF